MPKNAAFCVAMNTRPTRLESDARAAARGWATRSTQRCVTSVVSCWAFVTDRMRFQGGTCQSHRQSDGAHVQRMGASAAVPG